MLVTNEVLCLILLLDMDSNHQPPDSKSTVLKTTPPKLIDTVTRAVPRSEPNVRTFRYLQCLGYLEYVLPVAGEVLKLVGIHHDQN
jgi:hypothetical protein